MVFTHLCSQLAAFCLLLVSPFFLAHSLSPVVPSSVSMSYKLNLEPTSPAFSDGHIESPDFSMRVWGTIPVDNTAREMVGTELTERVPDPVERGNGPAYREATSFK